MTSNVVTLENLDEMIDQTAARMRADIATTQAEYLAAIQCAEVNFDLRRDKFLIAVRELSAELGECRRDISSVCAGIAEVQTGVDGLIEKVAAAGPPRWLGCDGPDGLGCDLLGCRCDCGFWDGSGCEHPLTPEEIARLGPCAGGPCTCFDELA